jgi:metabotropic glutamate receptor 1
MSDATSECIGDHCVRCGADGAGPTDKLVYATRSGDLYIGGLMSVHVTGDTPFTCGAMDKHGGAQMMQAFLSTVDKVNQERILGAVKLGAVAFDDCYSPLYSRTLITNIKTAVIELEDGNGERIAPSNIHAFVAGHNSPIGLADAEVLTALNTPGLGYRSTTSALSDAVKYPLFARTVAPADRAAKSIIQLLKALGWTYVQVIRINNAYGLSVGNSLQEFTAEVGICIAAEHIMAISGLDAHEMVEKIQEIPDAKAVVVIAEHRGIKAFLDELGRTGLFQNFFLIGGVAWADSMDIIEGREVAAEGTLSIKLKSPSLPSYVQSLVQIDAKSYTGNPWFEEWYQAMFN